MKADKNGTVFFDGVDDGSYQLKKWDKVNYTYKEDEYTYYKSEKFSNYKGTYIWAIMGRMPVRYVIEHPDGSPKEWFIRQFLEDKFPDGFESVHSSELKDGLTYIYARGVELELVETYKGDYKNK